MRKSFEVIVKWLSIKGRINRKDYFLCYLFPTVLLIFMGAVTNFSGVFYFCVFIAGVGLIKRFKDINIRISGRARFGLVSVWIFLSILSAAVAFILFLKGISGLGNKDMIESAVIFIAIPFMSIPLIPLIAGFLPGSPNENKYGPVPTTLSLGKGAFTVIISVVVLSSIAIVGFKVLLPSDPPLIQAIKSANGQKLYGLLAEGADPNQTSMLGTTALMLAIEMVVQPRIKLLLEYGADPNANSSLENKAQLYNSSIGLTKHTPLVVAISNFRNLDWIIELMLEKGANVNPDMAHDDELSPMLMAVTRGGTRIVKMLINHGVDLNITSNETALQEALNRQNFSMVYLLLTSKIDIKQLTSAVEWVSSSLKDNSDSRKLRTLEQLLQEAVNKQARKEIFPIQSFFRGAPKEIKSLTTYRQQIFRTPIKIRSSVNISMRNGPGPEYDKVDNLYAGEELVVIAITDVGGEFVWFKIRKRDATEGYVWGDYLCSLGDWYRGLQYSCSINFN